MMFLTSLLPENRGKESRVQIENNDGALLYTRYRDKVFGYIFNRLGNRGDAEDLTAEVFLKLYSRSDKIDIERRGISTFVFKVTQSVLFDHYRKNKLICLPLENVAHHDETDDLDEMLVHLNAALDTLTPREKEIVILHYYDGMSHIEIARRMGLSYTNVRQICHVAIKKLRKAIEENMNGKERTAEHLADDELPLVTGGLNAVYDITQSGTDELEDVVNKGGCGTL